MFLHCKDPLQLSEACLHGLLPSLNAPVAQVEELPNGPVRAAIVIYAKGYGELGLAIGMRALESGDTALYETREPIENESAIPDAVERALSFAEGLGFLFDDDMIDRATGTGRPDALEHWNRMMGDEEVYAPGAPAEPPPPSSNPGLPSADQALLPPAEDLHAGAEGLDLSAVVDPMQPGSAAPGRAMPHAEATEELLLDDLMEEVGDASEAELLLESSDSLTGAAKTVVARTGPGPAAAGTEAALPLSKFREPAAGAPGELDEPDDVEAPEDAVWVEAAGAQPRSDEPAAVAPDVGANAEGGRGAAALGKIAIKRQKGEGARALFARLLASF
jgi:hypothetical protein